MLKTIKNILKKYFKTLNLELRSIPPNANAHGYWTTPLFDFYYSSVYPNATYSPWLNDSSFQEVYNNINKFTLVDIYRLYELWDLAKQISNINGDYLEVGVWRGGSGILLAEAIKNISSKTIYLADTFKGVVKAGVNDITHNGGEHSNTSIKIVEDLINIYGLTNVRILEGIFPEDTAYHIPGEIAFIHCDVDVYQSSKDIVEWSLSRLSVGGVIVFDDYGFSSCEGVTKYCNELRLNSNFLFIHNLNGHAIFIKVK
jgi:O-methyltransferase